MWWRFNPRDRKLVEKNEAFFMKGSFRLVDMWRQQIEFAQESAFFHATDKTNDIRTYYAVNKRARIPIKHHSVTDIVPSQVIYRQTKLTKSPVKEIVVVHPRVRKNRNVRSQRMTGNITRWLVRRSSRQKPQIGQCIVIDNTKLSSNNSGVQILNENKESTSRYSAVSHVKNTRKIKFITN